MKNQRAKKIAEKPPVTFKTPSNLERQFQQATGWVGQNPTWTYLGASVLMVLVLFKNYLFGDWLYLFDDIGSDTLNVYYPQLAHIADYLRQDGIPSWSFSQGLGQNMFPNSLTDPFYWPLYLMGNHNLAYGIAWMEVLKILLAGWLFLRYLYLMDVRGAAAVSGALMYAFSGFAILGSTWYVFSANLVQTAFLLLGFELVFQKNKYLPFVSAVALAALQTAFNLYLYGVFLAIYFLFCVFSQEGQILKNILQYAKPLAIMGILGTCLAAVGVVPSLMEILNSPRGGSLSLSHVLLSRPVLGLEDSFFYGSMVYRMFGNEMAGSALDFTGYNNYLEASLGYCGWLCLILAPQVFWVLKSRREKTAYAGLLGLFLLIHVFPWFRYAYWGFTGTYFRNLALFSSIILILYATKSLQALTDGEKIPLWSIGLAALAWLALLFYPYGDGPAGPLEANASLQLLAGAFMAGYVILLMIGRFYNQQFPWLLAIPLLLAIELVISNYGTLHDRRPITKTAWETKGRNNYNDYTAEAVAYLKNIDQGFYRINKSYFSGSKTNDSRNDAKVFNFNGVSSYHSFNNKNFVNFLIGAGAIDTVPDVRYSEIGRVSLIENKTRWASGIVTAPILQWLTSAKYLLHRGPIKEDPLALYAADSLAMTGDSIRVLRWRPSLPLGFTYDAYMPDSEMRQLDSAFKKQIAMFKAAVVPDSLVGKLTALNVLVAGQVPSVTSYLLKDILADSDLRKTEALVLTHFENNRLEGKISVSRPKILCLGIPLDPGWKIMLNGREVEPFPVHYGLTGLFLQPGEQTVEMTYHLPYLGLSMGISLGTLTVLVSALAFMNLRSKRGAVI